jgi:hypothetical protein
MKTKLSLLFLVSCFFCLVSLQAQVPQGFNYQAVARNASGLPIINQALPVRMTIQSDSLGGTIFWQELHSSVITTDQGVINLVIGRGARQTASTVTTFSAIDWSITPKFLKIEIDYSGWKTLGVSRLWSVPYAMIAGDLAGTVDKLSVKGTTSGLEDALFEVKNKDGQTVFAVFNEGVRVYVSDGAKAVKGGFAVGGFGTDKAESSKYLFVGKDSVRVYLDTNPLTKKLKGGFAVGGYDMTKGTVQDYLDVNSDSVRIYIDSNPDTKKLKGGFAVGGYDMTKGTTTNYMDVNVDASSIINPSQNRILWYPSKNAFLTGKVLIEKPDSVGTNSFASGFESKAKGNWSQALGYKAIARGDYSTAIGKNAVANMLNAFAFGDGAKVINTDSYSFGSGAIAKGIGSYAIGSAGRDTSGALIGTMTTAIGDYSFALGQGSVSSGKLAFALGNNVTASGLASFALGSSTIASGIYSIAMGKRTEASGLLAFAMGDKSIASGGESFALGYIAKSEGNYSASIGWQTLAHGLASQAFGGKTMTLGSYSIATGYETVAGGDYSTAVGRSTVAAGDYSFAAGNHSNAFGDYSFAINLASGSTWPTAVPANTFQISGATTIGGNKAWSTLSDGRLKKDIILLTTEDNVNKIIKLEGIRFRWKDDDELQYLGLIAQDVIQILPEVVHYDQLNDTYMIEYASIIPVLIEGIKEQQKQLESYKTQLLTLQEKVDKIEALLSKTANE